MVVWSEGDDGMTVLLCGLTPCLKPGAFVSSVKYTEYKQAFHVKTFRMKTCLYVCVKSKQQTNKKTCNNNSKTDPYHLLLTKPRGLSGCCYCRLKLRGWEDQLKWDQSAITEML